MTSTYTKPSFAVPRLLLLNAEPAMAGNISLALGNYCMPFAFDEAYRSAVCGLLGEPAEQLRPNQGPTETFLLGEKTYLRRNLEVAMRDGLEEYFGENFTALLLASRLRLELPLWACCTVEDADRPNFPSTMFLVQHILKHQWLAASEICWLSISHTPVTWPTWLLNAKIRHSFLSPASLANPAEILSALEKLP